MKKRWKEARIGLLSPGLLLLAVWPCVVHMDEVRTGLEDMAWYPSLSVQTDFFMHIRSILLQGIAVWMMICIAAAYLSNSKKRRNSEIIRLFWPLAVYEILVILSTIFSPYQSFALGGMAEQYETVWTLTAYGVTSFYFYYMTKERQGGRWFVTALLAGAAIQCGIGISQLAGADFWNSPVGKWIVLLGNDSQTGFYSVFSEESSGQVYLSFYHPNYAAVYLVMVLPFAVAAVCCARKLWGKLVFGFLTAGLLACLWGTGSKTAFLVCLLLIVLGGMLRLRSLRGRACFAAGCGGTLIFLLVLGFLFPASTPMGEILENAFPERAEYHLKEVTPGEEAVKVVWDEQELFLTMEEENGTTYFSVKDERGVTLPLDYDDETERFSLGQIDSSGLTFEAYTQDGGFWIVMYQGEIPWYFTKTGEADVWEYINLYQKPDVPINAPYAFGGGYENALSGRMYLWSRSIPLLKDYLLIGSGPDTFPLIFPQNDYVARANIGLDMLMPVISKVHSFYLQVAIQTGILSLVSLVIFFGSFFQKANLSLRKRVQSHEKCAVMAAFILAAAGFLLMGITNDSVTVVSPVFWAVLGMGISYADADKSTPTRNEK